MKLCLEKKMDLKSLSSFCQIELFKVDAALFYFTRASPQDVSDKDGVSLWPAGGSRVTMLPHIPMTASKS